MSPGVQSTSVKVRTAQFCTEDNYGFLGIYFWKKKEMADLQAYNACYELVDWPFPYLLHYYAYYIY